MTWMRGARSLPRVVWVVVARSGEVLSIPGLLLCEFKARKEGYDEDVLNWDVSWIACETVFNLVQHPPKTNKRPIGTDVNFCHSPGDAGWEGVQKVLERLEGLQDVVILRVSLEFRRELSGSRKAKVTL